MKIWKYLRPTLLAAWIGLCCLPLAAQAPIGPSNAGAIGGGYVVGPGDTLNVQVFDSKELSGPVQVGLHGELYLPYDPEPIQAGGKSVAQIIQLIQQSLERHHLEIQPKVTVQVITVKSRPIVILGAVRQPITLQAVMPETLRQCLTQASGLSNDAGRYILLTFANPGGQPRNERLFTEKVLFSTNPADNPLLRGGDEVRVTYGSQIYVIGAVNTPGAFPYGFRNRMTVLRAIAMMHGWKNTASPNRAWLIRAPKTGKLQFTKLNLSRIIEHKAHDMTMMPNDILYVPNNTFKAVGYSALATAVTILTGAESSSLGILFAQHKIY